MGIAAILSVVTGTLTARLLKFDTTKINDGLYGFSATLVGVALLCFFQSTLLIWSAVLIGSVLATLIQHLFIIKKIPVYTFPFILVVWLFLAVAHYHPTLTLPQVAADYSSPNTYLALLSHGLGQVIFQSNIWAGILFVFGIFINNPITTVYGLGSVVLSGLLAYQLNQPVEAIHLGLLSYNAVLCAMVFTGKKIENLVLSGIAVILSVLIMAMMMQLNLPALTFPFVLATWLTSLLNGIKQKVRLSFK